MILSKLLAFSGPSSFFGCEMCGCHSLPNAHPHPLASLSPALLGYPCPLPGLQGSLSYPLTPPLPQLIVP